MIEDLKIILKQGKPTSIKGKEYLSAKDYISPFVERMSAFNATFRCNVKMADQLSITDKVQDVVYNRVHIQAILPDTYYYKNDCNKVIGMVYGLDVRVPTVKFYIADIDKNKNIISFDDNHIKYQEIEDGAPIDYSCIKELLEMTDINNQMLENLKTSFLSRDTINAILGDWIDFALSNTQYTIYGKISIATSLPIKAYKKLFLDKDSDDYINEDENITLYKIYKAFLKILSDENDILNEFEKTRLIGKMLKL